MFATDASKSVRMLERVNSINSTLNVYLIRKGEFNIDVLIYLSHNDKKGFENHCEKVITLYRLENSFFGMLHF